MYFTLGLRGSIHKVQTGNFGKLVILGTVVHFSVSTLIGAKGTIR